MYEQVSQGEVDYGTVAITASASATDSQAEDVHDESTTWIFLNRDHGLSLGEVPPSV